MNSISVHRIQKYPIKLRKFHPFFSTTTSEFEPKSQKLPFSSTECESILQSLTNSKSLKKGKILHGYIVSSGVIHENTYLSTKLAAFYANCGCMCESQIIFDQIVNKSSFLWNFMIRGYATNHLCMQAVLIYAKMRRNGFFSDNFTYPFVIKACGDLFDVRIGRIVHAQVVISGFESDIYVGNCLLSMFVKFRDLENARGVFDRMPIRDLTSWNTLISGYAKNGNPRDGLRLFEGMLLSGMVPDSTTLLGVLSACSELKRVDIGKQVHGYVLRKRIHCPNKFLSNSLIEVYCNCLSMVYARRLFELLQKDSVSWNTLMSGYARNGKGVEGLRLFCQMVRAGRQPDLATFIAVLRICDLATALVFGLSVHSFLLRRGFNKNTMAATALMGMYSQCGELTCSRLIFDEIEDKNLVSWTAMISAYGHHGMGKEAISILHQMTENGIVLDEGAFTSILTACSHAGLVEEGREIFHQLREKYNIKPKMAHYACLVDLLSRAGQLEEACEIICSMAMEPSVDIWAAFLSGCRHHGNVTLAEVAGQKILEGNLDVVGGYICLSHVYADEKRWTDVENIRGMVQSKGMAKPAAYSSFIN